MVVHERSEVERGGSEALPREGVLNPNNCSEVERGGSEALPREGVLNPNNCSEVERGGSEALPREGVLNPNNCSEVERGGSEALPREGVLNPNNCREVERGGSEALPREGVLNPNNCSEVERGGSGERLKAEDKRAIDLLRTSSGSASLDGGRLSPNNCILLDWFLSSVLCWTRVFPLEGGCPLEGPWAPPGSEHNTLMRWI